MTKRTNDQWQLWIMVMPLLAWLALFTYRPLSGLRIAFQDYSPFLGDKSPYIMFDNFKELLVGTHSDYFWRAFRNTIMISIYGLVFAFPMPIILAILFHQLKRERFRKTVQTIMYVPHFISEVIVCSIVVTILGMNTGLINIILQKIVTALGGEYTQLHFLAKKEWFWGIFTGVGIWKECGFESIVYFAALCGVSEELYEAAKVDGAGRLKQIWHVSIPGIMPTIATMFIIRVGNMLNVGYERVLLLYNPGIYETADILSTFTYRLGIQMSPEYGLSTAASIFNSVISLAMVIIANKVSRKISETGLW